MYYLLKLLKFSVKKQQQNIYKNTGKVKKNTEKVGESCQSGKAGTMLRYVLWKTSAYQSQLLIALEVKCIEVLFDAHLVIVEKDVLIKLTIYTIQGGVLSRALLGRTSFRYL